MDLTSSSCVFVYRVHEKEDKLTKQEKRAADYMLQNLDTMIYSSITELAEHAHTSEATITRLCVKLGFAGFQALKISVAQDLVPPTAQHHSDLSVDDPPELIAERIFDSAAQTLNMTKRDSLFYELKRAIDALNSARKIIILGSGNSGAIAQDAHHKFLRIGLSAYAYTDAHMQMIAVSSVTQEDAVLAFSHSGSSKNITDALRLAKENGAATISITSSGSSPVSKVSSICLHTYAQETQYRMYALSSRIAELAIIDSLYTGVSLLKGEDAVKNFKALEKALIVNKY